MILLLNGQITGWQFLNFLDKRMSLRLKEIWQNQLVETGDSEYESYIDVEPKLTEFDEWLKSQELICYYDFNYFEIWD